MWTNNTELFGKLSFAYTIKSETGSFASEPKKKVEEEKLFDMFVHCRIAKETFSTALINSPTRGKVKSVHCIVVNLEKWVGLLGHFVLKSLLWMKATKGSATNHLICENIRTEIPRNRFLIPLDIDQSKRTTRTHSFWNETYWSEFRHLLCYI